MSLIKDILDWHKETFPNATEEAVAAKLLEEAHELWCELVNHEITRSTKSEAEMLDEVADVFIVATRYIDMRSGGTVSILDIIEKKMERNKRRTWGPEEANGDRRRVK
jgi:NTP pyrophosphatase (non-canonical NTP hydrolase)